MCLSVFDATNRKSVPQIGVGAEDILDGARASEPCVDRALRGRGTPPFSVAPSGDEVPTLVEPAAARQT